MSNPNPWQSFIDAAERKAFQSDVMVSLKGWATNWLEANAMKGDKGDKGDQGIQGLRGLQGERGPKGDRGPRGYDGKDGKMGPIGPQGPAGRDGKDGINGRDGRDGKDGKRGQRGPKGEKGDKGERGERGPAGPPGGGGGGSVNRYRFLGDTSDPGTRDGFADDKWINYTSKEIFYRSKLTDNWTSLGTLGSGGGGGASDWGDIGGTLSDQTDLQAALDLKAPLASPAFTGTPTTPTLQANNSGGGTLKSNNGTTALSWGGGGGANVTIANALQMTARTANRALVTDGSKNVISSATTDTELGYLSGVTSAVQTQLDSKITSTEKGAANGVAPLDASSKIASTYLPALALSEVFVVASEVAQLALTAEEGDVAVRTDENKSYIHNGGTAGDMTDWQELLTPTDSVLSVNGQTGTVSLDTGDIAEGSNLYYTEARVSANTDVAAATSHVASTSNPHSVTAAQVGLGNVENTALSTWAGSANITTLGTIATGTWQGTAIAAVYVGNLPASKITSGTFNTARIPNLDTSKITTGTFADARISESSVTQHEAALSITESQISDLGSYATVDANGGIQLASLADATANNSTMYFSTDAGTVVWKNASGVVQPLYGGPAVYASSL